MSKPATKASSTKVTEYSPLAIAPARVLRGNHCLANSGQEIATLGVRPLVIGGNQTLKVAEAFLQPALKAAKLISKTASYIPDCAESSLVRLKETVQQHQADLIIGVGGGKALDMAKLVAYQCGLPISRFPLQDLPVQLGQPYLTFTLRREHFNMMLPSVAVPIY